MRKTLKAGIRSETAVNQFFFKKITLAGARINFIRKSIIKIIQIVRLVYSSGLLNPHINSITNKTSHTKPKKIIGPSKNFSY